MGDKTKGVVDIQVRKRRHAAASSPRLGMFLMVRRVVRDDEVVGTGSSMPVKSHGDHRKLVSPGR